MLWFLLHFIQVRKEKKEVIMNQKQLKEQLLVSAQNPWTRRKMVEEEK